jgi:catechol 2,3-dioxygenase-like lactoylglutathione lyase family enzyme
VDALITASIKLEADELTRLHQVDKPVLAIGDPFDGAYTFGIDNFGAAKLATGHLISLGHRRIGIIGGDPESETDFRHPETRHRGYLAAVSEHELPTPDEWFYPTDFTIAGGYAAAKNALSDPRLDLTALFAASDEIAICAILAARDPRHASARRRVDRWHRRPRPGRVLRAHHGRPSTQAAGRARRGNRAQHAPERRTGNVERAMAHRPDRTVKHHQTRRPGLTSTPQRWAAKLDWHHSRGGLAMPIQLNHTIVHARDRRRSAEFLTGLLGLDPPTELAPFLVVQVANGVSLDFMEDPEPIHAQHYAFLVTEDEFDQIFERITGQGLAYWADPFHQRPRQINHNDGGRGLYWSDPDGHNLEIITRPYGG